MHMHLRSESFIYMSNVAKSADTGSTLSCTRAAHDPDQHPVWNYLYQERIALLIRFLPLLTENVNR